MPYYHGDRVFLKLNGSEKLKLGRVQEVIEEPEPITPISSPTLDSYDYDYGEGGNNEKVGSSSSVNCSTPITPPAKTSKVFRVIPLRLINEDVGRMLMPSRGVKKSTSDTDLQDGGGGAPAKSVKLQVVWDDYKGARELLRCSDDNLVKVIDRKFTVGQQVFRAGVRGKVTEVIQLATVRVCDGSIKGNNIKNPSFNLIPDLNVSDIQPISPFFNGVNIEYRGWIGQITEVERAAVYKLEEPIYNYETYTWRFHDSYLLNSSANSSKKGKSKRSSIPQLFAYPYNPTTSVPYKGKVDALDKTVIKTRILEREKGNKENKVDDNGCSPVKGSATILPGSPVTKRPSLSLTERRKRAAQKGERTTGTVESVSVVSIKVRWTGRLPMDLIKPSAGEKASWKPGACTSSSDDPSKMPPALICKEDLKLVRPLYVHPALYFDKMGLCICNNITKGMIVSEKQWVNDVYMSSACHKDADTAPFDLSSITLSPPPPPKAAVKALRKDSGSSSNNSAGAVKRKLREGDNHQKAGCGEGEDVIVCKHFVKHIYKVIWEGSLPQKSYGCPEGGDAGLYYGNQLEPDLSQEHKLCLGLIHSHLYVVAKRGTLMDGISEYGVVIKKPSDDSVVVEWMTISSDGNAVTVRTLKTNLAEIDKHPTYNDLHEGKIVVRRQDASKYKLCKQFRFGTVVSVQRFCLGQISVYCPIEKRVISLWPHMLEVYVGMSLQELISHNMVGLNKEEFDVDVDEPSSKADVKGRGDAVDAKGNS